jgi:hypothetical protein
MSALGFVVKERLTYIIAHPVGTSTGAVEATLT